MPHIKSGGNDIHIEKDAILAPEARKQGPERTLLLGWNRRGPIITFELSRYVAPGSLLTNRRRYA